MGINKFGLNQDDMDYMNFLNSNTRAVGVDTICLTLGMDKDTVQTKIEPYLLSKCYIQKQPRSRVITDLGRSMMGEYYDKDIVKLGWSHEIKYCPFCCRKF